MKYMKLTYLLEDLSIISYSENYSARTWAFLEIKVRHSVLNKITMYNL